MYHNHLGSAAGLDSHSDALSRFSSGLGCSSGIHHTVLMLFWKALCGECCEMLLFGERFQFNASSNIVSSTLTTPWALRGGRRERSVWRNGQLIVQAGRLAERNSFEGNIYQRESRRLTLSRSMIWLACQRPEKQLWRVLQQLCSSRVTDGSGCLLDLPEN